MKQFLTALFAIFSFLSSSGSAEVVGKKQSNVLIIPIREQIAAPQLHILRRGLKAAIEREASTVILDMETPGGELAKTFEMLKAIEKFPGKVITYVNSEAISAGALISAGTDEIYFSPTAIIGAAAPVSSGGQDIDETMKQKVVSYLKARVRSISDGKGYRGQVISAMIDAEYELKIGDEIIKPKGELLTLTASEAMRKFGEPAENLLGAGIHSQIEGLMDEKFGKGNYHAIYQSPTWSESIAQYITSLSPLLLAAGLLLLFIEFKTPGFGLFGISGGVLLGILFFGHHAAGLSGHEAALCFFLGLFLVLLDIFLLPGFFLLAIPGALLMLGSLLWGMSDIWPKQTLSWDLDFLIKPLNNLVLGILGAIGLFAALLRFMPKGALWGGMVLDSAVGGETTISSSARHAPALIGATGKAVTALFPSGQIEIDGERYDARLQLGTADLGSEVKVIAVGEFELSVELLPLT